MDFADAAGLTFPAAGYQTPFLAHTHNLSPVDVSGGRFVCLGNPVFSFLHRFALLTRPIALRLRRLPHATIDDWPLLVSS